MRAAKACEMAGIRTRLRRIGEKFSEQTQTRQWPYPGRMFKPGQSGNPSGRPKGIEALARVHTTEALAVLARALSDEDTRVAVSAAGMLLAYGWGRPKQVVDATDNALSLS